jgi:hypothetical protein
VYPLGLEDRAARPSGRRDRDSPNGDADDGSPSRQRQPGPELAQVWPIEAVEHIGLQAVGLTASQVIQPGSQPPGHLSDLLWGHIRVVSELDRYLS